MCISEVLWWVEEGKYVVRGYGGVPHSMRGLAEELFGDVAEVTVMEDEIREEGWIEEADEEYDFIESEGEGKIFLNLSIEDDGGDE